MESIIWRVFGPLDNNWGWGQVTVLSGTYQAIFELDGGKNTFGGFDEIELMPGECDTNTTGKRLD